jgi:hypothetical protein
MTHACLIAGLSFLPCCFRIEGLIVWQNSAWASCLVMVISFFGQKTGEGSGVPKPSPLTFLHNAFMDKPGNVAVFAPAVRLDHATVCGFTNAVKHPFFQLVHTRLLIGRRLVGILGTVHFSTPEKGFRSRLPFIILIVVSGSNNQLGFFDPIAVVFFIPLRRQAKKEMIKTMFDWFVPSLFSGLTFRRVKSSSHKQVRPKSIADDNECKPFICIRDRAEKRISV